MAVPAGTAPDDKEPSAEDLAAIERESGLISAEMALLDAEIRIMCADGDPSAVDWQRLRRAVRDVLREHAQLYADEPASGEHDAAA
jgi:Family of unknown function (DUF6284)